MSQLSSILIWGPGHGHNITHILEYFNTKNTVEVYFLTQQYSFRDKYNNINIIDYYLKNKFFKRVYLLFILLRIKRIDILYIQGESTVYDLFTVSYFGKFRKKVYNVWSENIINKILNRKFTGKIYKLIFNRFDLIQCNWHGTYNKLVNHMPYYSKKAIVQPGGLKPSFFIETPPQSDFIKEFVKKLAGYKSVLLNLRSIADYNAIEVLLHAFLRVKGLNKEVFDSSILIFWPGNNVDPEKRRYINLFINKYKLHNNVKYVDHPFVPDSDIRFLITNSDIIVNLVKHDQLSSSVLEAIYLEKDQLLSDIEPYRILNSKYDMQLNLLELEPNVIADEIISIIISNLNKNLINGCYNHKMVNKSIVFEKFSLNRNFDKMFKYMSKL
jgi:hypothetical protein